MCLRLGKPDNARKFSRLKLEERRITEVGQRNNDTMNIFLCVVFFFGTMYIASGIFLCVLRVH